MALIRAAPVRMHRGSTSRLDLNRSIGHKACAANNGAAMVVTAVAIGTRAVAAVGAIAMAWIPLHAAGRMYDDAAALA